jgi:hypothetical protein
MSLFCPFSRAGNPYWISRDPPGAMSLMSGVVSAVVNEDYVNSSCYTRYDKQTPLRYGYDVNNIVALIEKLRSF